MLVENKVIIVTGAASPRGIGKATARALAAQGANVVILDLRLEDARSAAEELGARHLGLACDVTDKAACERAALASGRTVWPHRWPGQQRRHHAAAAHAGYPGSQFRCGGRRQPARYAVHVAGRCRR
ncbi:SDR family oxidoreductase [Cupriavidus basilensis]